MFAEHEAVSASKLAIFKLGHHAVLTTNFKIRSKMEQTVGNGLAL